MKAALWNTLKLREFKFPYLGFLMWIEPGIKYSCTYILLKTFFILTGKLSKSLQSKELPVSVEGNAQTETDIIWLLTWATSTENAHLLILDIHTIKSLSVYYGTNPMDLLQQSLLSCFMSVMIHNKHGNSHSPRITAIFTLFLQNIILGLN